MPSKIINPTAKYLCETQRLPVINPATELIAGHAPTTDVAELDHVLGAAAAAQRDWGKSDADRRIALMAATGLLEGSRDRLASVLTTEQGKTLAASLREVDVAIRWLRYFAELRYEESLEVGDGQRETVVRRPLGVVAAISPWNYPLALAMWKIAPALRSGNTVVVKPSPYTPLSTLALVEIVRPAIPEGVLTVVAGQEPLGSALVSHPVPRKVSFTGSTEVGRVVGREAISGLKRVTLELGGNDPALVLPDADLDEAAEKIFWAAFNNNGQTCLAVKRVYAHESVRTALTERLVELAQGVKVGDPTHPETDLGPVGNLSQLNRVSELVSAARTAGGRVLTGGRRISGPGYFYPPTLVDKVSDGTPLVDEEQFGPALPIIGFTDLAAVVDRINAGPYGLTASVWTSDEEQALQLAVDLEVGQFSINAHGSGVTPHLPFAGAKDSGIGVENGIWGLHEFSRLQTITGGVQR